MKNTNGQKYIKFFMAIATSLGLLFLFNNLGPNQIKFFLDFYKTVVEVFFGNSHYFYEEEMYYVGDYYVIGSKCIGLNMIVLLFTIFNLVGIKKLSGYKYIIWWFLSAIYAIFIGVFANILRLLSSIYFVTFMEFETIHALLGIIVYLSTTIFAYIVSEKILERYSRGDKSEKHI